MILLSRVSQSSSPNMEGRNWSSRRKQQVSRMCFNGMMGITRAASKRWRSKKCRGVLLSGRASRGINSVTLLIHRLPWKWNRKLHRLKTTNRINKEIRIKVLEEEVMKITILLLLEEETCNKSLIFKQCKHLKVRKVIKIFNK